MLMRYQGAFHQTSDVFTLALVVFNGTTLSVFCCSGRIPRLSLIPHSVYVGVVENLLPRHSQGSSTERWSRNTTRMVSRRTVPLLKHSRYLDVLASDRRSGGLTTWHICRLLDYAWLYCRSPGMIQSMLYHCSGLLSVLMLTVGDDAFVRPQLPPGSLTVPNP